jgi:cell division protein FtsA
MGNNVCTVLDVGSSKIACAIFEVTSKSEVKILGSAVKFSSGMKGGVVDDVKEAISAISYAVHEAEKQAGVSSKKIISNISHPLIHARLLVTDSNFGGRQVVQKDLQDISAKVLYSAGQSGYKILHFATVQYDVDTIENVQEPEYMFAGNLKSYHSAIYVPSNAIAKLNKALRSLHFTPIFVVSGYAAGLSVALGGMCNFISIDIGAGTSDIAVFGSGGAVIWAGSFPLGGDAITKDISECFSIPYADSEKLKILYGNLIADQAKAVELAGVNINISTLNKVIYARLEEIFELILSKIPKEYHMQSIVLSGGVAKTAGISELVTNNFGKKADIIFHSRFGSVFSDPALSTINGLIDYYLRESNKNKSFSIKKILSWMWENF